MNSWGGLPWEIKCELQLGRVLQRHIWRHWGRRNYIKSKVLEANEQDHAGLSWEAFASSWTRRFVWSYIQKVCRGNCSEARRWAKPVQFPKSAQAVTWGWGCQKNVVTIDHSLLDRLTWLHPRLALLQPHWLLLFNLLFSYTFDLLLSCKWDAPHRLALGSYLSS